MTTAIKNEIQHIVKQIITGYKPENIILFGSYANGTNSIQSDIDLVIIKETSDRFVERLKKISAVAKTWEAMDMLVYTPEEWSDALSKGHYFIKQISNTGKVLYEKRS